MKVGWDGVTWCGETRESLILSDAASAYPRRKDCDAIVFEVDVIRRDAVDSKRKDMVAKDG
jgi:hypothetical protein